MRGNRKVLLCGVVLLTWSACKQREMPAERPVPGWLASAPIECPEGTDPHVIMAKSQWAKTCQTPEGVRHGPYMSWKKPKVLLMVGQFDSGVRTGDWKRLRPNGDIEVEQRWVDDNPVFERTLHRNGRLESEGALVDGQPDGIWFRWNRAGRLVELRAQDRGTQIGMGATWRDPTARGKKRRKRRGKRRDKRGKRSDKRGEAQPQEQVEPATDNSEAELELAALSFFTGTGHPVLNMKFHQGGAVAAISLFDHESNRPLGVVQEFGEAGNLLLEERHQYGHRVGIAKSWSRRGIPLSQVHYADDGAMVREYQWYKNASPKRTSTVGDTVAGPSKRHGEETVWWKNGAVRSYRRFDNGERDGLWRSWSARGTLLSQREYERGKPVGQHRIWNRGGGLVWSREHQDGHINGLEELWSRGGQKIWTRQYRAGKPEGAWEQWWPDGSPWKREQFVGGLREGETEEWNPWGQRVLLARYRRGQPHGTWQWWGGNGQLLLEGEFEDGRKVGTWREWDHGGDLVREYPDN